uniref:hypothetical protein n=1 Tax=Ruegeria arenilitoris TaxID=1173585 RepID=UPI00147D5F94|nr:hypothetical protein [Ruegeria arenilitoris]
MRYTPFHHQEDTFQNHLRIELLDYQSKFAKLIVLPREAGGTPKNQASVSSNGTTLQLHVTGLPPLPTLPGAGPGSESYCGAENTAKEQSGLDAVMSAWV